MGTYRSKIRAVGITLKSSVDAETDEAAERIRLDGFEVFVPASI
jgi:hypothetical protein